MHACVYWGSTQEFYRWLYGVYCLSSTFINALLGILGSLGIPFTFLRESRCFIKPALSHSSINSSHLKQGIIRRQREKKKPNCYKWACSHTFLEHSSINQRRNCASPSVLVPMTPMPHLLPCLPLFGSWSMRKWKKQVITREEGEFCTLPKC